jgi:hypothetical protein
MKMVISIRGISADYCLSFYTSALSNLVMQKTVQTEMDFDIEAMLGYFILRRVNFDKILKYGTTWQGNIWIYHVDGITMMYESNPGSKGAMTLAGSEEKVKGIESIIDVYLRNRLSSKKNPK